MKALEKLRTRRYETASALAGDVRRFLADEPVEARPPSKTYQLKKFVQRNLAAVLTAGSIAAALLAGASIAIWQAVRATQAEIAAEAETVRALAQRTRAEEAEALAQARLKELTIGKQRAAEEAAVARQLYDFTREQILGEHVAASVALARVIGEIVDQPTANSKRTELAECLRRHFRAQDALRSLAKEMTQLPPRLMGADDEAFMKASLKAGLEANQKIVLLGALLQKYPNEMSEVITVLQSLKPPQK